VALEEAARTHPSPAETVHCCRWRFRATTAVRPYEHAVVSPLVEGHPGTVSIPPIPCTCRITPPKEPWVELTQEHPNRSPDRGRVAVAVAVVVRMDTRVVCAPDAHGVHHT